MHTYVYACVASIYHYSSSVWNDSKQHCNYKMGVNHKRKKHNIEKSLKFVLYIIVLNRTYEEYFTGFFAKLVPKGNRYVAYIFQFLFHWKKSYVFITTTSYAWETENIKRKKSNNMSNNYNYLKWKALNLVLLWGRCDLFYKNYGNLLV